MFKDIDLTLREMGAGDLGVGKRVKVMSESFMGRLTKYSQSVENKDATMLADTLSRNLYREKRGLLIKIVTLRNLYLIFMSK